MIIRVLAFCCIMLLGNAFRLSAQVLMGENLQEVRIDALSDDELRSYWQRARNAGLTTEAMLTLAGQRGLPPAELAKLRQRLGDLSTTGKVEGRVGETDRADSLLFVRDSMQANIRKVLLVRDTTIFGSELFTTASLTFEPNLRIATPVGYVLGPDDELTVQVFGYSEQTYRLKVGADGTIYIPNVGPLAVGGLTIEEATARIRQRLASTIYRAINSGQTRLQVSLSGIKSIQVTVIGQAMRPGTYTVSSLTTLYNLLYLCGGPSDNGSYRNIEVIRGNSVIRQVDLYGLLAHGRTDDNVLLAHQDVVRIPYYGTRVVLNGEVKRKGKFEMLPSESFGQLLEYAGGFSDSAYRGMVKLVRLTDQGRQVVDLTSDRFADFKLSAGDAIEVDKGLSRFLNRVQLRGAVLRPGQYEYKPGMRLSELLRMAGGLTPDAFQERGVISRVQPDLTAVSLSFQPGEVVNGRTDMPLQANDEVTLLSLAELRDEFTVEIEGEVRSAGTFRYRNNMTVKDLVLLAGGLTKEADSSLVEISRRVVNQDVTQANYVQSQLLRVDLRKGFASATGDVELLPFDVVMVRHRAGSENMRSVYVEGMVMNTGRFVLERSNERISELLKRTGGFRGAADSSVVTIRRVARSGLNAEERQRVIERLLRIDRDSLMNDPKLRDSYLKETELLTVDMTRVWREPGGNEDIILEDGDQIQVARASSLVRVNGEVYHPTYLPFESGSRSARYYIRRSGDFTPGAAKSKVFVLYPDGRANSVSKVLFVRKYPAVVPRSEVYVPAKARDTRPRVSTAEWVAISSILATLATIVIQVTR